MPKVAPHKTLKWLAARATGFAVLVLAATASAELKSSGNSLIELYVPAATPGKYIEGRSSALFAKESKGALIVHAWLDCDTENRGHASCIKTGDWVQERQLWKLLESDKYREATLSVPRSQLKLPTEREGVQLDATGTFSLHGKEQPLHFNYSAQRAGKDIHVQSDFELNLKDFNIVIPPAAGIRSDRPVEVKVRFTLRDL